MPVESASDLASMLDDDEFAAPPPAEVTNAADPLGIAPAEEWDVDGDESDHVPVAHEAIEVHLAIHGFQGTQVVRRAGFQKREQKQGDQ